MRVSFKAAFLRDLRKLRDRDVAARVHQVIEEVERADLLTELQAVKKLQGETGFYRIRIGDYRIGVHVEGDVVTFVRCLHRRDIYRAFPP